MGPTWPVLESDMPPPIGVQTECRETKCRTDKMSNRQNVEQTKCRRTKCRPDSLSADKMSKFWLRTSSSTGTSGLLVEN